MTYIPFLKSPIIEEELVNAKIGIRANGNCRLIKTLSRSFIPLSCPIPSNIDMNIVGAIAIVRVNNTRCHRFHFKFRKP